MDKHFYKLFFHSFDKSLEVHLKMYSFDKIMSKVKQIDDEMSVLMLFVFKK